MNDNKNDRVRPMDEAAKQMYRNDPGLALKVEGQGHIAGITFVVISVSLGFLIKVLG